RCCTHWKNLRADDPQLTGPLPRSQARLPVHSVSDPLQDSAFRFPFPCGKGLGVRSLSGSQRKDDLTLFPFPHGKESLRVERIWSSVVFLLPSATRVIVQVSNVRSRSLTVGSTMATSANEAYEENANGKAQRAASSRNLNRQHEGTDR